MSASPPLRFLAIVLGGWAALRTALIAPLWPAPPVGAAPAAVRGPIPAPLPQGPHPPLRPPAERPAARARASSPRPIPLPAGLAARSAKSVTTGFASEPSPGFLLPILGKSRPFSAQPPAPVPPALASPRARRWALSAWTFVRRGDGTALAAGGLLGGSQAGARLTYRLNRDRERPLALSLRLASPLARSSGAEAAAGLDWRPVRNLPVHLLAERRQAIGQDGRSAFALTIHGGVSEAPLGRLRLDAYAQAGMVGIRSRDLFGDGSARLSLPFGDRFQLGAGAWASAQPGLSRLDLGPQARLRLPVAGRTVAVAADWRVRVAGNGRPGSGPSLTLATDF